MYRVQSGDRVCFDPANSRQSPQVVSPPPTVFGAVEGYWLNVNISSIVARVDTVFGKYVVEERFLELVSLPTSPRVRGEMKLYAGPMKSWAALTKGQSLADLVGDFADTGYGQAFGGVDLAAEPVVESERRPGLSEEAIDWDAHKAFGRSL